MDMTIQLQNEETIKSALWAHGIFTNTPIPGLEVTDRSNDGRVVNFRDSQGEDYLIEVLEDHQAA